MGRRKTQGRRSLIVLTNFPKIPADGSFSFFAKLVKFEGTCFAPKSKSPVHAAKAGLTTSSIRPEIPLGDPVLTGKESMEAATSP